MPWIEVKPMDAKVLFISDCLRKAKSFSGLCRAHGISRKTGYKWIKRYKASGFDGLLDQSRRPHHFPCKAPYQIRKKIIELRKKYKYWGAKKIREKLIERHPDWDIPSETTVYNMIKVEGLIQPNKRRRRVAPNIDPLSKARKPNELWTADFKGQFLTGEGTWCYPLTIMDHASRYLLACDILPGTRYKDVRASFERVFQRYGIPDRIRTDNGVPFASISVGGLSKLSVWWISLGIVPERIEPGKPQQNGRHERMHRTLKKETASPPAQTLADQQRRFDEFSKRYNEERPHEAIGMVPPKAVYQHSMRRMPARPERLIYPGHYDATLVNHNGCIWLCNKYVYLGYLLQGQYIGLEEVDENLWDVYLGPIILGSVRNDQRQGLMMTRVSKKV
jgi:transposase InsO family protein